MVLKINQVKQIFADSTLNKLTSDSLYSLVIKVMALLLSFMTIVLINRFVEPSQFGAYMYALSLISLLKIFSVFGGDRWLMREVASSKLERNERQVARLRNVTLLVTTSVSLIFAIALYTATHHAPWLFNSDAIFPVRLAAVLLPAITVITIFQAYFRGIHRAIFAQIPDAIFRPLIVIISLPVLAYMFIIDMTGTHLMGLQILATLLALLMFIPSSRHLIVFGGGKFGKDEPFDFQSFFRMGISLVFIAFVNQGNMFIVNILLGNLASVDDVALFSVSKRISDLVTFMQAAIVMPLAPVIATKFKQGNKEELMKLGVAATLGGLMFALPVSAVLIFFSEMTLSIFGSEYKQAVSALQVMVIAQIITVFLGPVTVLLTMTKNEGAAIKASIVGFVTLLCMAMVLIPQSGAVGGALAFSAGLLVTQLLMFVFVLSKVGIDSSVFGLRYFLFLRK